MNSYFGETLFYVNSYASCDEAMMVLLPSDLNLLEKAKISCIQVQHQPVTSRKGGLSRDGGMTSPRNAMKSVIRLVVI